MMTRSFHYVGSFVDELIHQGVRHLVFSPGSRSTPLLLLAATEPDLRLWRVNDERSAAFFALGIAKAIRQPVAILCTSGTAAANYFPAIVEARISRVPLIALTADRPHENRANASPQAIDQIKMFGDHVKWFFDVPEPSSSTDTLLDHARQLAAMAATYATESPAGPVHLNFPFREPLIPLAATAEADPKEVPPAKTIRVQPGRPRLAEQTVRDLHLQLSQYKRGLIVCGPQDDPTLPPLLASVAAEYGMPILADPLSGLRTGDHDKSLVIDAYDVLLREEGLVEALRPDVIVHVGGTPVSKSLGQYTTNARCPHIVIDDAQWRDPFRTASEVWRAHPADLCADLLALANDMDNSHRVSALDGDWTDRWVTASTTLRSRLTAAVDATDELFEGKVFTELTSSLPDDTLLFVGNSMPIRDLDMFFASTDRRWQLMGNRGVNGIDGVLSTALGAAVASRRPLCLVLGDLSFHHDIGALLTAKTHGISATVVLVNNDGGGIFSFLPQAELERHFEPLFGTPHGIEFEPIVRGFGGRFHRITDWHHFGRAVTDSFSTPGLDVVEIVTDRERNVALHRAIVTEAFEGVRV